MPRFTGGTSIVHEAEDEKAQVFLAMVKGLPGWIPSDVPFIAWFYRLATNAIISLTRRQRLRRWIGLSLEPTAIPSPPQDDAEELHPALRQILEPFQRTLILHYLEQLPVNTMAQILGNAGGVCAAGNAMKQWVFGPFSFSFEPSENVA